MQSGELDNTSEKSGNQKNGKALDNNNTNKSENGPGPAPEQVDQKLSRSQKEEAQDTPSTNNKELSQNDGNSPSRQNAEGS